MDLREVEAMGDLRAMAETRYGKETSIEDCRRLVEQADDLRYEDPGRAVALAERARDLCAALDIRRAGAPWYALQADAWAVLGSARRAVGELRDAEAAFNVALGFLDAREWRPFFDPLAQARVAQRAAYLRCDQKRFGEALDLIDEAIAIYEERGAPQPAAGALADRGLILGRADRKPEAVAHLLAALDVLDASWCPRNFLAVVHNLAVYFHELADGPEEERRAREWLELAQRCHAVFPESVNRLKLLVLQGLAAFRLGQTEEGLRELWAAHDGFKAVGAVQEQTLLLLKLAAVYLQEGRPRELKKTSGQLFPLLRSTRIPPEVRFELCLFYRAAQAESATLGLIESVSEMLGRSPYGHHLTGLDIEAAS